MARIVYLSWPATEVSGGIKAAFQHVELLGEAGMDAVIASQDGALPGWFDTRARVVTLDQVRPGDVLVFPENNPSLFKAFTAHRNPKLVFCQNQFLVYQGLEGRASYADHGVTHIMCPSHTVMHYCRRRFPGLKLGYTPFYVDHSRFVYRAEKTLQIATVPRKRPMEFGAIGDLFRASYPQHRALPWVYMHKATEAQVADVMGRSAVFLSLARLEAHGMTKLEAMASGCIVAGFRGVVGGTDSANSRNGLWVEEDDILGCVDALARAVQLAIDRDRTFELMVEEGRRTAYDYRREEAARLLVDFWRQTLLELPPRPD
ncbi:MAG TPA: glycosyltransferase [Ramlibacter sp.]|nr:glycosyltransferase [Ramlibacter sp.]